MIETSIGNYASPFWHTCALLLSLLLARGKDPMEGILYVRYVPGIRWRQGKPRPPRPIRGHLGLQGIGYTTVMVFNTVTVKDALLVNGWLRATSGSWHGYRQEESARE